MSKTRVFMHVRNVSKFVLVCWLLSLAAAAQQPPLSIPSSGSPGLDQYRASRIAIYTDDFGELKRYREADAALPLPAEKENRVVFLGRSEEHTSELQSP